MTAPRRLVRLQTLGSVGLLFLGSGCATVGRPTPPPPLVTTGGAATAPPTATPEPRGSRPIILPEDLVGFAPGWTEVGVASWYGPPFHGRATASGEIYDMDDLTAAHQTLPFGTRVEVVNLDSGQRVELRINDRGPFVDNRVLDVSRRGAQALAMVGPGTARVRIEILEVPEATRCWEVQVGAFRESSNAELRREAMQREGLPARIEMAPDGVHRVRVGPFVTRGEAQSVRQRFGGVLLAC